MAEVVVFDSNLAGRHGIGSVKPALHNHGVTIGVGVGRCGNSYAIPTKDCNLKALPLENIKLYVEQFLDYARYVGHCEKWTENTEGGFDETTQFNVVAIGCGRAGYTPEQIAPMFADAHSNVTLPDSFTHVLNNLKKGSIT